LTEEAAAAIDARIWGTGSQEVIRTWTGSAFDGRNWYFGFGGGHGSYNGNELYAFDFSSLHWRRLYDPSPLTNTSLPSGDLEPVWGPRATHHYDGWIYAPRVNALFYFGFSGCWRYAIDESDPRIAWQELSCPNFARSEGFGYGKTALHPDNGNIILFGGGLTNVAELDVETHSYSRVGDFWNGIVYATYDVADTDPVRRRVYSINSDPNSYGVLAIDIDSNPLGSGQSGLIPGSAPPVDLYSSCFVHHPVTGLMIAIADRGVVYSFDPGTVIWQRRASLGGLPTPSHPNGPLSKCVYLPSFDLFAFDNNENEGVWLYRLDQ
jgi:hypothetical protein